MESAKIKKRVIFGDFQTMCYFYKLEWVEFYRNPPVKGFVRIYNRDKNWTCKIVWPHLHFFKVHSWIKIPFAALRAPLDIFKALRASY